MENRLKERLTGAAILVALIVMLVPEMFHGQGGDVAAVAGSSGEGPPVRSYTIDLSNSPTRSGPLQSTPAGEGSGASADKPPAAPAPEPTFAVPHTPAGAVSAPSAPPAAPPAAILAPVAPLAKTPPTPTPTPMPAPMPALAAPIAKAPPPAAPAAPLAAAPKADTPAASVDSHPAPVAAHGSQGGWSVQLGLFAKRENAERLAHSAQSQGFAVSVSNPDAKGLYRVYTGSMADRASAEAVSQRLKDHGFAAAVLATP
jgi:cell division septation protein DedD